jgi:diguanylate cyclase (GGDEF)-like protein
MRKGGREETPFGGQQSDVARGYAVRLMQHLVVPTFVLNPQRKVVVWNRACERLTGVDAASVLGTRHHWQAFYKTRRYCLADLVALDIPEQLGALYSEFTVSDHGFGLSAENWCVMPKLGNQLYLAIDAGPIHDEDGRLIAIVETLRDMTDQKRAEQALQALATSDGLTGLANRRSFDQALAIEWARARRTRSPISLLLVDVDHFKSYNDVYGHQQGDDCLRTIASAIRKSSMRPADVAARYGGEEFAILLPDTDSEGAHDAAARLRSEVRRRRLAHRASGAGPHMTVSIGIATQVPVEDSSELLVARADQALYAAKRGGRDRVVVWERSLQEFADAMAALPKGRQPGASQRRPGILKA